MAQLLEPRSPPTSIGGLKSAGRDVVGYGTAAVLLAAGVGLAILALPWIKQVPFVGAVVGTGAQALMPNQASAAPQARTDRFGTVMR